MAFFDKLTQTAKDVAEVVAEKAKDAAEVVSEKAKDVSEIAKIRVEILQERRELDKNYKAIGEWFVSEFEGAVPDAVKDVVAAVNASKIKIAELEAAKVAVKDVPAEQESAAACPVCGTVCESKFCPECGAPMKE